MTASAAPLFAVRDLSKRFGPVLANQGISLEIHAGRIHALLGENGAGKSTLMSMLAGRARPDGGTILHQGQPVTFSSPAQAIALGVGMVYQRLMLVAPFTVAENLALTLPGLTVAQAARRVEALGRQYGMEVDPGARIADLSLGERQRVEILKLLARDARLLILDEPTAVLTPGESEGLFAILKTLAAEGRAVIVITHKLEEVLAHADEISVLRRGRLVATGIAPAQVTNRGELARLMVGREVVLSVQSNADPDSAADSDAPRPPLGREILRLDAVAGPGFADVSLSLRRGEILAVVGVAGNGQERLAACLAGLERFAAGSVTVDGRTVPARDYRPPRQLLASVPEDRHRVGSVGAMRLTDNCMLTRDEEFLRPSTWLKWLGLLDKPAARKATARIIAARQIAAPSPDALAGSLSGGNLQKLILGRELGRHPQLLVVEQPTQGLDVRATRDVWQALLQSRAEAGVLLVTGDLKEALSLADRVAVFFRGRVMEVLSLEEQQGEGLHRIGLLMAGVKAEGTADAAGPGHDSAGQDSPRRTA